MKTKEKIQQLRDKVDSLKIIGVMFENIDSKLSASTFTDLMNGISKELTEILNDEGEEKKCPECGSKNIIDWNHRCGDCLHKFI